jgi:hypothetical protein
MNKIDKKLRQALNNLVDAVNKRDDPDEPAYEWQGLVDRRIKEAYQVIKEYDNVSNR